MITRLGLCAGRLKLVTAVQVSYHHPSFKNIPCPTTQRRSWLQTTFLLFLPLLFCSLLVILQTLVNSELKSSRDYRCGCKCVSCCDWQTNALGVSEYQCYEATDAQPCSAYASCKVPVGRARTLGSTTSYNSSSTRTAFNASAPAAALMYTGKDRTTASALTALLLPADAGVIGNRLVQAGINALTSQPDGPDLLSVANMDLCSPNTTLSSVEVLLPADSSRAAMNGSSSLQDTAQQLSQLAHLFSLYGIVLGTPTDTTVTNLLEPAFISGSPLFGTTGHASNSFGLTSTTTWDVVEPDQVLSLYYLSQNCSALSDTDVRVMQQMACGIQKALSVPLVCATLAPIWQESAAAVNADLYCGWLRSGCSSAPSQADVGASASTTLLPAMNVRRAMLAAGAVSKAPHADLRGGAPRAAQRQLSVAIEGAASAKGSMRRRHSSARRTLLQDTVTAAASALAAAPLDGYAALTALHEYPSVLVDWRGTSESGLDIGIWVNNSDVQATLAPAVQRWNAPLSLAANALLKHLKDSSWAVRLEGVKGFPTQATALRLDLASLLGPMFFLWVMQILLPSFVHSMLSEREGGQVMLLRQQGLRGVPYSLAMYLYCLATYVAFMVVFVGFGAVLGLNIFTKTAFSVQFVLYLLWGHTMIAWAFWFAAFWSSTLTAILVAIATVIFSGLVANLIIVQFVQSGPEWLADLLQVIPSFALYRGVWEMSQYAFLANINGGDGLTWAKLSDRGNGMRLVWGLMAAQAAWGMASSLYYEQVFGADDFGLRKHPFFLLGFKLSEHDPRGWAWFFRAPQALSHLRSRMAAHQAGRNNHPAAPNGWMHLCWRVVACWHLGEPLPGSEDGTGGVTRAKGSSGSLCHRGGCLAQRLPPIQEEDSAAVLAAARSSAATEAAVAEAAGWESGSALRVVSAGAADKVEAAVATQGPHSKPDAGMEAVSVQGVAAPATLMMSAAAVPPSAAAPPAASWPQQHASVLPASSNLLLTISHVATDQGAASSSTGGTSNTLTQPPEFLTQLQSATAGDVEGGRQTRPPPGDAALLGQQQQQRWQQQRAELGTGAEDGEGLSGVPVAADVAQEGAHVEELWCQLVLLRQVHERPAQQRKVLRQAQGMRQPRQELDMDHAVNGLGNGTRASSNGATSSSATVAAMATGLSSAASPISVGSPTGYRLATGSTTISRDGTRTGAGGATASCFDGSSLPATEGMEGDGDDGRLLLCPAAEQLRTRLEGMPQGAAVVLRNLRKVFPGSNGSLPKVAVAHLSLAVGRHECFGLLGPNGAGKTTTLRLMQGMMEPSAGNVLIQGLDMASESGTIAQLVGICPQHDVLWGALTAAEHLALFGRIKGLRRDQLAAAVEQGLQSVDLLHVAQKPCQAYSGGMRRRLSVACALVGRPSVVYLDEPSTGLDPASRRLLWQVVREARRRQAVVLTTHSMEEAEVLCDRLGIFVDGCLQCIGAPKELTARYSSYLLFSLTTPASQEEEATQMVLQDLCSTAKQVYHLGGTQTFELPRADITLQKVFATMTRLRSRTGCPEAAAATSHGSSTSATAGCASTVRSQLKIMDWGVSNATLEQVFIKVVREAGAVLNLASG